jgi:hypothetical protein
MHILSEFFCYSLTIGFLSDILLHHFLQAVNHFHEGFILGQFLKLNASCLDLTVQSGCNFGEGHFYVLIVPLTDGG